jgi:hypothetical protein
MMLAEKLENYLLNLEHQIMVFTFDKRFMFLCLLMLTKTKIVPKLAHTL